MRKEVCEVCKNKIDERNFTEIKVTVWKPAGMSIDGSYKTLKICNKNACSVAIYRDLERKAQEELDRTKTNAVGPLAPGSPGCSFNS